MKKESQLGMRIDIDTKKKLKELSVKFNLSSSDILRKLINKAYSDDWNFDLIIK